MYVLGIESATDVCGVSLAHNSVVLDEISREEKYVHAKLLVPMMQQLLLNQKMELAELDGIAISIGPGSFTGLRIGLSVAKGLAYASDIPLIAVSTIKSIAENYLKKKRNSAQSVVAVIEIQRNEFAVAQFSREANATICNSEVMLWTQNSSDIAEDFFTKLSAPIVLCGVGAAKFYEMFFLNRFPHIVCAENGFMKCSAAAIALLGEEQLLRNDIAELDALEPNYMKEFIVKTTTLFQRIQSQ